MRRFAELLETLALAPGRGDKLAALSRYFADTPDPDRGWAYAALTGDLSAPSVGAAAIRKMVSARVDPVLFALSYDFVGDLAETAALIWPAPGDAERASRPAPPPPPAPAQGVLPGLFDAPAFGAPDAGADPGGDPGPDPGLAEVVAILQGPGPAAEALPPLLDRLDPAGRLALLKLGSGGMRVGVSAAMAGQALAQMSGRPVAEIEALRHALAPPYAGLFAWAEGGEAPQIDRSLAFRPLMLANPLEAEDLAKMTPADWAAELKWDGIRVEAACGPGGRRLWSRNGEEISAAFPDLAAALRAPGCVDGELMVLEGEGFGSFNALQARLGRKTPSAALMAKSPAVLVAYDLLHDGEKDLTDRPWAERRAALEAWVAGQEGERIRLSPLVPFDGWEALSARRDAARAAGEEGLMLKRRDAAYVGGRPAGIWWKWKRDPLHFDCVVMYAQRGHGRRGSFYSDYTFGVWQGDALVPVGKAYSGFTDAELTKLDRWVRANAGARHGLVRGVAPELVLEIACDALSPAPRRRAGISMRFPRVARIRWDKPAAEADRLETLRRAAGLTVGLGEDD